ncbi:hypothetical protein XO10_06550 [Marinitoga sp. 1135]|uniref:Uncharacterized protein n=1 Tax=Marinitoga piezophila (strain DSM 14283 / JCM 11233 / KA3) TaxID=443254 RepID=H2J3B6_MARPK|nr:MULTISPECIES: hypothetical protein [Marinitoga]AEX85732.1 hypothetical protein Marpi_1329 [Marinitoga piezophila KA3]APT76183.1 hypothetical protein LN42_07130 [Marinitoga sp. 1137]NUU95938.1 hypothetical protein [Marinitoga sp. 1135]
MNPLVAAMVKFAILGTAGEVVAKLITKSKISITKIIHSAISWAILGVIIKYAFIGFNGFVHELVNHHYLPSGKIYEAFFKSFFTNAMFGPWLVIIHRFLDNLPKLKIPTEGLKGAMLTLLWFWVPAHTITFSLPGEWQITLAAVWSFVLGLILGIFANLKKKKEVNNA